MNDQRLLRVLSALMCEPWMITPEMHREMTRIAVAHSVGGDIEAEQHAVAAGMPEKPARRRFEMAGDVAVIPIEGVIGRKFSSALYSSGVTSIDVFERILKTAIEDEEVAAVVLSIDSPGGLVTGVPEAAAAIYRARDTKPVISYADGLMASAAYYLASQADAIFATDSARVGSVGVYLALLDYSRNYANEGVVVEMFKSGRFKGMGYPGTSLSDEQRRALQERVDSLAQQFKAAVRAGRMRDISDDVMQGQDFSVADAQRHGLIDSVTELPAAIAAAAGLANDRRR